MARPKEFDPGEATKEAMEAFWQHGYHATSVNNLLAEMKLNRGSLYGTFGDKKSLFLATLKEYEKQGREILREHLERQGPARASLKQWLCDVSQSCTGEAGRRGCLGLKAAMELAPHDPDIAAWMKQVTREREMMLAKAIRRGQNEGEIDADLDARATARFLISSLAGLRVLGTASPSEREVREVIELVLRVLGSV